MVSPCVKMIISTFYKYYISFRLLFRQVALADVLIINKIDLVGDQDMDQLKQLVRLDFC